MTASPTPHSAPTPDSAPTLDSAPTAGSPPTPEQLLARFGLSAFRPGQRQAVEAALHRRDSLVVMPTGAGKSLCYQLPALHSHPHPPFVLVVSPLIALMEDQLRGLSDAGVRAVMLASTQSAEESAAALAQIVDGSASIALVAPERFASAAFREALAQRKLSLFVVDEAHCVAEWGHDFRPDYLRLRSAIEALHRPPVMATTATATKRVAEEIAGRLGLRDEVRVSSGFDRPALSFDVLSFEGKGALGRKRAALAHLLSDPAARPSIVYCGTRKDTDALAEEIGSWGISTVAYHAGLPPQRRMQAQEAFMSGAVEVIVATNAFGMGVDKSNVRTVAHWAIPTSLEGYYQEAGRGGRDSLPARAVLLASRIDLGRLIRFNTERNVTVEEVRAFVGSLRARAGDHGREQPGLVEVEVEIGRGELDDRDRVLLSIAERAGAASLQPGRGGSLLVTLTGAGSSRAAHAAIKAAKDRGWEAYRAIERFVANSQVCRRRQILHHFGDEEPCRPAGRCCDVCHPDEQLIAAASVPLPAGRGGRRGSSAVRRAATHPGAGAPSGGAGAPRRADQASALTLHARGATETPLPVDEEGFERLRAWRLSRAEGKPAYTVATNAALAEALRKRPSTIDELLEVKGIGPAFCEKHGESLLHELASI